MIAIIELLKQLGGFITGGGIIWKFIRHYRVLSDSSKAVSQVIQNISNRGDKLPEIHETQIIIQAMSNVLKTGIIDIPGIDEYKISAALDKVNENVAISFEDYTSGQFHILRVEKVPKPKETISDKKDEVKNG